MSDTESKTEETVPVESQKQEPPKKKNNKLRIVAVVLLLGVAGVALWYFVLRQPAIATNLIEVSGRIETDDATVSAKTSGRIREISVREGDTVKAGQVIAILDDEQIKARESQAQAAVTQTATKITRAQQQIGILREQLDQSQIGVGQAKLDSQGRVRQAEAQVSQTKSQISQVQAQLAQAEVNLSQARYDEGKLVRLYKTGDVSEKQMKQAQTNAAGLAKVVQAQSKQVETARGVSKAAQASLTIARANLANPSIRASQSAAVQKQMVQAQSDIDSAQAEADRARAQLQEAQANRADLKIVAPFDGIVATRSVEPGEVVTTGGAIITLINPNLIYLRAFVPESKIGLVKVGQRARVYLDSDPNKPLEAEVSRIDMEAAFTPENTYFRDERVKQVVGIKLMLKNPGGFAKPGMPADGEVLIKGEWTSNTRHEQ